MDWIVLDVAYVLCLVGGTIVLRAKIAGPLTWIMFGLLSVGVGGFLFGATYFTQAAATELSSTADAAALLASC